MQNFVLQFTPVGQFTKFISMHAKQCFAFHYTMDWILASASPRRKELFGEVIKKPFDIIVATGEEKTEGGLTPEALVMRLAKQKAEEVATLAQAKNKAVLGADTVVALGDEILGKPKDEKDAFRMLKALSGNTHEVYTGVCIVYTQNGERKTNSFAVCTKVKFYPLSNGQIREYIATGSPMDKAGAYGIQDGGLVEKIEGSFTNVVGLPVEECIKQIRLLQGEEE